MKFARSSLYTAAWTPSDIVPRALRCRLILAAPNFCPKVTALIVVIFRRVFQSACLLQRSTAKGLGGGGPGAVD